MKMLNAWKQVLKRNRICGSVAYYAKHGLFPEARKEMRLRRVERLKAIGDYDAEGISSFQGLHEGEACVIVGNGPSVSIDDLNAISDAGICCFGANRISDIFPKTKWRPTYACALERGFLGRIDGEEKIDHYITSLKKQGVECIFINDVFRSEVSSRSARSMAVYIRCPLSPIYSTALMPFSEDASLYVSDLGSVTHFAIQIACYMGFRRIYLYGVDNTYRKYLGSDGVFHVSEQTTSHAEGMSAVLDDVAYEKVPHTKAEAYCAGGFADLRKAEIGYRICKDYAAKHGIEVLNATRGGTLEVFSRINLEDALRKEAVS